MRRLVFAAGALFAVVVGCSASGGDGHSAAGEDNPERDSGPLGDSGSLGDGADAIDPDAEPPLVCGEAGFCETRLPKSELGLPLSLQAVWVVASNDVWSVSAEGSVLHYDGASWKVEFHANHALSAVWATPTTVWVGGEGGLVVQRSAVGDWSRVETASTSTVRAISGTSDAAVWIANEDGFVDYFDGSTLKAYAIDVPGIRITSLLERPGPTMYATGYVAAKPVAPSTGALAEVSPYVLQFLPSSIVNFNPSLQDRKGFVPVSFESTNGPDEEQRFFLLGYGSTNGSSPNQYNGVLSHGSVGVADATPILEVEYPAHATTGSRLRAGWSTGALPRHPISARTHDDVLMPFTEPFRAIFLLRWNGIEITQGSLAMGREFPARSIFGLHSNAGETWIVGDGLALKGGAQ